MTMSDLLQVRGLKVELPTPSGWIRPVNEVSLRIATGESLGLVGESGSGKTMMALALMGLLPVGARVSGEARLSGEARVNREDSAKGGTLQDRGANKLAPNSSGVNLTDLTERAWRDVRGREIAMVFQEPMTALNPVMR